MKSVNPRKISIRKYKALFNTFYDSLCLFANKYLDDIEVSKDLVQDVFIRVWDKEIGFDNDYAAKSYLYTAVKNRALDYLKSKAYRSRNPLEAADLKELESDTFFAREVLLEESSKIVREAVEMLPYKCKEIINLSLKGYKNDEISQTLSISVNTVKAQKRIAYSKLRVMLKGAFSVLFSLL